MPAAGAVRAAGLDPAVAGRAARLRRRHRDRRRQPGRAARRRQRVRDRVRRRRPPGDRGRAAGRRRHDRRRRHRRGQARARARGAARHTRWLPTAASMWSRRCGRCRAAESSTRSRSSGRAATIRQAWDVLAPGGTATVVGLAPVGVEVSLPAIDFLSEKTITGSYYGSSDVHAALGRLVQLVVDGRLDLGDVVSYLIGARRRRGRARAAATRAGRALGDRDRRGTGGGGRVTPSHARSRRADRRGVGRRPGPNGCHVNVVLGVARNADGRRAARHVHDAGAGPHPDPGRRRRGPGPLRGGVAADDHDQQGDGDRGAPPDDHLGRGAAGDRAGRARRGRGRAARAHRRSRRVRVHLDRPGRVR